MYSEVTVPISRSLINNIHDCYFRENEYYGAIINFTDSTRRGDTKNVQSNLYLDGYLKQKQQFLFAFCQAHYKI